MESAGDPPPPMHSKQYAALRSDLSAALSAFDRAQDWADLIHDLQRVNRVFAKHSNSAYLPEKQLLAKRLAQCLTSSLPSGVHLKALETYRLVFSRIGPSRLARDLPLYAGGLFPLFSYSATSLKPALLSLYESQFLPLGPSLAPLLDGLALAVLPGLEDESSEFYERSVALLDSVATAVADPKAFCRALWRALLLSPPMRLPAANYIRSRLTSESKIPWTRHLLSDMPLVSHAMAGALNDRNALVQRSVLDLLLGELALDLPFFEVHSDECQAAAVALVGGVFGALLRRDVSLTKRVHSWLLGGKEGDRAVEFCNKYSRRWLLGAIDDETARASVSSRRESASAGAATRPCKVIVGLINREELFASIAADLALRVLRYARKMLQPPNAPFEREVQHGVSEVVAQLGSSTIFGELERFVAGEPPAGGAAGSDRDKYELLSFALLFAPTKEDVVRLQQLPGLLRAAVGALHQVSERPAVLKSAVSFCGAAMSAMEFGSVRGDVPAEVREVMPAIAATFTSFFVAWLAASVRSAPPEMRRAYADIRVEDEVTAEFATVSMREENDDCANVARAACSFLTSLVASRVCGAETTKSAMQAVAKCASAGDMRIALAGARAYAEIAASSSRDERKRNVEEQTSGVIRKAWRLLHPSLPTATASNAQVWLLLQRQFPEHVNVIVADGILSTVPSRRLRNLERFACVWRLSVEHRLCPVPADEGLFLMLDALDDRDWGPKMLARSWLSDALTTDAGAVVDAPLRLLLTAEASSRGPTHEFAGVYDAPRALYAFQVLRSVVESSMLGASGSRRESSPGEDSSSAAGAAVDRGGQAARFDRGDDAWVSAKNGQSGARALSTTGPSARTLAALAAVFGAAAGSESKSGGKEDGPIKVTGLLPALDYVSVLAATALGFLRGRVPGKFSDMEQHPLYEVVQGGPPSGDCGVRPPPPPTAARMDTLDDESEWLAAGLGFKPFSRLHASVAVAAAEFFAKLMSSLPSPAPTSARLAERLADPLLNLVAKSISDRDSVLQLHYLEAVEAIVVAEGNCFPLPATVNCRSFAFNSTIDQMQATGKGAAGQPGGTSAASQHGLRQQQAGSLEVHPLFLPWMLGGLSQACKAPGDGRDVGSQEVLGLRRRWIRFAATILKHVGATLPMVAEGTLLTVCKLLEDRHVQVESEDAVGSPSRSFHESEFSRIDERLLLLKGLASLATTTSCCFEFALRNGRLCDESRLSKFMGSGEIAAAGGSSGLGGGGEPRRGLAKDSNGAVAEPSAGADPPASGFAANARVSGPSDVSAAGSAASSAASAATMSMMSAIHSPFRMLNDFVKDVFTGSASDGLAHLSDPRRSAARCLYMHLPSIVSAVVPTWGPQTDPLIAPESFSAGRRGQKPAGRRRLARQSPTPRLSRELPRERRQAQRQAVLAVIEPLFASRPTDVVAAIVTMFCAASPAPDGRASTAQSMAVDMLRSLNLATPEVVVSCAAELLDLAMRWDVKRVLAEDGRAHLERRSAAVKAVADLVNDGVESGLGRLDAVTVSGGQGASGAPLAGGRSGEEAGVSAIAAASGTPLAAPRPYAVQLFHAGDFFAAHVASDVETAVLRFLEHYLVSCRDGDDVQGAWPALHLIAKEAQLSHTRKASLTGLARALAAFANRFPRPHPDKRCRRELMVASAAVISTCGALASGTVDLSAEVPPGASSKDVRARHMFRALESLAVSVPTLIDSSFVDERAQLLAAATAALTPAVATLRRTAAKAATSRGASRVTPPVLDSAEAHVRQRNAEEDLDDAASLAAADMILCLVRRDWGAKIARRELVGLLDDPNFFYGKHGEILSRLAAVVSEAIAAGGAAALLSSIGTTTPVTATGIPGLFTGRDSESVLRARAVRRVAFCVFVAEPDHYLPQLPSVLERLRDSLRLADPGLVVECMLCLRVLLLRTGPASIAAFRATTLSEMFRIASEPAKNLAETLATLQFLDLVALISPPDFGYVRCFFFSSAPSASSDTLDGPAVSSAEQSKTFYQPLIPQLAALCRTSGEAKDPVDGRRQEDELRMEAGRTVFSGRLNGPLTEDFVGRYAAALASRNRSPAMANALPDFETVRRELEMEFCSL